MVEFGLCFAIVFRKEGLDEAGMQIYLQNHGIEVTEIIDDEIINLETKEKEDEVRIFICKKDGALYIPLDVKMELNLMPDPNQKYVYYPIERGA